MHYFTTYTSPLGEILLASDDEGLTHLAFDGQKYFPELTNAQKMPSHPILISAQRWLDSYFAGENPELTPPLHASGSNFQRAVWQLLLAIPYGETTTYGAIAQEIARLQQRSRMSAQAVGGAVGHNPIGIIVPCHRVVGASGSLTGYAGGLDKKIALLNWKAWKCPVSSCQRKAQPCEQKTLSNQSAAERFHLLVYLCANIHVNLRVLSITCSC